MKFQVPACPNQTQVESDGSARCCKDNQACRLLQVAGNPLDHENGRECRIMGKGGSLHRAGHPQTVRPCDFADSLQDGSRMPSWVSAMIGFEHRFSVLLTAH